MRLTPPIVRAGCAVAITLAVVGCTPGGQFDPTVLLSNDMFDTKKPVKGNREPVFPDGVPGVQSGVPPDLVKGYQPPPEQSADTALPAAPAAAPAAAKPKPKPKVARAPAQPPTRINVGAAAKPAAPAQAPQQPQQPQSTVQSMWPEPTQTPAAAPQTASPSQSQSVWPPPPPTGSGQPVGQSSQSIWPNPPPLRSTQ